MSARSSVARGLAVYAVCLMGQICFLPRTREVTPVSGGRMPGSVGPRSVRNHGLDLGLTIAMPAKCYPEPIWVTLSERDDQAQVLTLSRLVPAIDPREDAQRVNLQTSSQISDWLATEATLPASFAWSLRKSAADGARCRGRNTVRWRDHADSRWAGLLPVRSVCAARASAQPAEGAGVARPPSLAAPFSLTAGRRPASRAQASRLRYEKGTCS
jgi:hypothetical protein